MKNTLILLALVVVSGNAIAAASKWKTTGHQQANTMGAPAERPPNIVVILADDLGCCDMAMYGGWGKTPRIEQMAKEGMLFTDFHANSSVCSPTRTAFLTGRYQQRAGIVDVIVGNREPESGIRFKAEVAPGSR